MSAGITTIIADLVKALGEARHEGFEELHPDLIKRMDAALASAEQLDLDRAEVRWISGVGETAGRKQYLTIALRPTRGDANG